MKPFNLFFTVVYYLGRALLSVLFPATVEGLDRLPRNGVLLCPNHSSNWDPVLIGITTPVNYRLRIMAKDSLFHIPVLGPIVGKLGAFPVDRGNFDINSVKTAIKTIRDGENLLVFPEGTRVEKEGDVEIKGGVAVIGIRTGAIFVPVFVDGKKRPFHKTRLIFGEPYRPTYTGRHGTAEEVQQIANEVMRRAYALGEEHPL